MLLIGRCETFQGGRNNNEGQKCCVGVIVGVIVGVTVGVVGGVVIDSVWQWSQVKGRVLIAYQTVGDGQSMGAAIIAAKTPTRWASTALAANLVLCLRCAAVVTVVAAVHVNINTSNNSSSGSNSSSSNSNRAGVGDLTLQSVIKTKYDACV